MQRLQVMLGERSYPIEIVQNAWSEFGAFVRSALARTWSGTACRSALLVVDQNVAALAEPAHAALKAIGLSAEIASVPAGEASKSIQQAAALWDTLVAQRADRHTLIVALGGGVVGDLAGFVAATYVRGLPLLMIPTTLLAQVDSSVGGKVGINHPGAKNIIGAFHQPIGVWIDIATLESLPAREWRCGLAEVVKYGVIHDERFFESLEANAVLISQRDMGLTTEIVRRSCEIKAAVVGTDEREQTGARAALNFGHTIGHAIEATAGYGGEFQHGEAVAVGMVAEALLAQCLGWIKPDLAERLRALLTRFGLPVSAPGLDADTLLRAMTLDKKNQAGSIGFVLPERLGAVRLTRSVAESDIRAALAAVSA